METNPYMSNTKQMLRAGNPVLGGWSLTGHPAVAEIMADEGFDFIGIDMEHTPTSVEGFYHSVLAAKGTGCDVLARLPSCDPVLAKQVLDMGAAGIIVPSVNTPAEAAQAVVGGFVQAYFSTQAFATTQRGSEKLRMLGISSTQRVDFLPDVATFRELGYPDLTEQTWYALFVRSETPRPVLDKLRAAFGEAVASFEQALQVQRQDH